MPIVQSTYTLGPAQQDGRRYCRELHTDQHGAMHTIEYLADATLDVDQVLALRAADLGARIDVKEAAEAVAMSYEIGFEPNEFMDRFTFSERVATREVAKTDPAVADLLDYLAKTRRVYRGSTKTVAGLDYLTAIGVLAAGRKTEILA